MVDLIDLSDLIELNRESFPRQKVKVGRRTCTCTFVLIADGKGKCSKATAKCDRKCSGTARGVKMGDFKFTLSVRNGKAKVLGCTSKKYPPTTKPPTPATTTESGPGPETPNFKCACVAPPPPPPTSTITQTPGPTSTDPPTMAPTTVAPTAGFNTTV